MGSVLELQEDPTAVLREAVGVHRWALEELRGPGGQLSARLGAIRSRVATSRDLVDLLARPASSRKPATRGGSSVTARGELFEALDELAVMVPAAPVLEAVARAQRSLTQMAEDLDTALGRAYPNPDYFTT